MNGRLARMLGVAAAAVMVGGFAGASPAGAAALAISVTPNTGLSDGQQVVVSGTGFTGTPLNGGWVFAQCRAAILDQPITLNTALDNCGFAAPAVYAVPDAAGNFSTLYPVHATVPYITGALGTLDCTVTPCVILVAQVVMFDIDQFAFVGAAAPISFGNPPPACPGGVRPGHGYGDRRHCHEFHQADKHD